MLFLKFKRVDGIAFKSSESALAMMPTIGEDSIVVIHPAYVDALALQSALANRIGDDVILRQTGIVAGLPESASLGVYNAKLHRGSSELKKTYLEHVRRISTDKHGIIPLLGERDLEMTQNPKTNPN